MPGAIEGACRSSALDAGTGLVPKLLTSDLQADATGIGSPRRGSRRGSADERRLTPQAK
jgi:hypothetical protein